MSKLNEEEIIKNIKEQIQWSDHNTYKMALQGLLNLYNKEKEKNNELKKELDLKIKALDIAMSNPDYICKDKIKEKIEVIQKRIKEETRTDFLITLKILENELQELLEERN